ncbi:MAG: hypothetical protein O7B25_14955 [Gammaproteobacteria bacterium]|nr:hypothetical protein [Gammaproteobacteria bacterium]
MFQICLGFAKEFAHRSFGVRRVAVPDELTDFVVFIERAGAYERADLDANELADQGCQ